MEIPTLMSVLLKTKNTSITIKFEWDILLSHYLSLKGESHLGTAKDNVRPINIKHENLSTIGHSGNSDVDVKVIVDTTPIAYAMLCSFLAAKQISTSEFESSVRKLESLVRDGQRPTIREINDLSKVKLNKKQLRGQY